jgi:hypothetical protein
LSQPINNIHSNFFHPKFRKISRIPQSATLTTTPFREKPGSFLKQKYLEVTPTQSLHEFITQISRDLLIEEIFPHEIEIEIEDFFA